VLVDQLAERELRDADLVLEALRVHGTGFESRTIQLRQQ